MAKNIADHVMTSQHLNALGIKEWQQRPVLVTKAQPSAQSSCAWTTLQSTISQCTKCALHASRTQTVFGVGARDAELMLIGEAPGFNEDQQGEPFVGRAGQLLNAILRSINYEREQIFIANVLKCRPPQNRDPLPDEVKTCTPYLDQQMDFIKPKLVVALGRIAAHYLLNTKASLESLRGKIHTYGKDTIPLIVTYHPAYLLRNPADKKKSYQDWKRILEHLMPC